MAKHVSPIPQGFHSVTPYLSVHNAAQALEFYKRAFGAQELMRTKDPQGKVSHAEIKIGDSVVMLAEETPNSGLRSPQSIGATTASVFLYVNDADSTFKQAVSAGAKSQQPVTEMFWGDRYGRLTDPFGHSWSVATHIEDVSPEEMNRRAQEATKQRAHSAG